MNHIQEGQEATTGKACSRDTGQPDYGELGVLREGGVNLGRRSLKAEQRRVPV